MEVSPKRSPLPLVIYKVGGSLFDLPQLPGIIRQVIGQRPDHHALLVPGGGPAADLIRKWDDAHHLGNDAAHDLAIQSMDLGVSLLARFFPEARLVRSEKQVRAADGALSLLCAGCFISAAEAQGHIPLERSWRVTSDSIAAWSAQVLSAAELVLVKSVALPDGMTPNAAAVAGLVDECFPQYAAHLPAIGWVNARADSPVVARWIRPDTREPATRFA